MALQAAPLHVEGFVGNFYLGDMGLQCFMAIKAERRVAVIFQHGTVIGGVGAVAADAIFLDRFMYDFFPGQVIFFVAMAGKTDIIGLRLQETGKIRLVGAMAGGALAHRHRPMKKFTRRQLLRMTPETKPRSRTQKHEFIRRLMGTMAFGAIAVLYRFMHGLLAIYLIMAGIAEPCHIVDGWEFMFARFLVAHQAIIYRHGAMHILVLAHRGMTIGGDARCFRKIFGGCPLPGKQDQQHP